VGIACLGCRLTSVGLADRMQGIAELAQVAVRNATSLIFYSCLSLVAGSTRGYRADSANRKRLRKNGEIGAKGIQAACCVE
jgi:hypothetical protein